MICIPCGKASIDGLTHPGCRGKYTIDGAFSALSYNKIVKKLIYNFKYEPFLSDLKNTLIELFYESIIQNEVFIREMKQYNNEKIVLAPIPLHKNRLRKRGYNHAKLLADRLSIKLNLIVSDILIRVKDTKIQAGLKREERQKNVSNAFSLQPNNQIFKYPNIFLVDDILTTGSTLLEAANTLKRKGTKRVWGLTLARG